MNILREDFTKSEATELALALEKMVNEKLPNLRTLGDCGGSSGFCVGALWGVAGQ